MSEFKWLGLVVWWPLFALWTEKEAPISVEWVPFPTPHQKSIIFLLISFYASFVIFICPCHRVPSLAHVNEKTEKNPWKNCFPEDIIWSYVIFFWTLFVCNLIICDVFWTLFVCNWIFGGDDLCDNFSTMTCPIDHFFPPMAYFITWKCQFQSS